MASVPCACCAERAAALSAAREASDSDMSAIVDDLQAEIDEEEAANAAKAAGLPDAVLRLAQAKREALES